MDSKPVPQSPGLMGVRLAPKQAALASGEVSPDCKPHPHQRAS